MRRKCDLSCACLHNHKNLYPPIKTETKSNKNEGAKFILHEKTIPIYTEQKINRRTKVNVVFYKINTPSLAKLACAYQRHGTPTKIT